MLYSISTFGTLHQILLEEKVPLPRKCLKAPDLVYLFLSHLKLIPIKKKKSRLKVKAKSCPRSHSSIVAEQELEPGILASRVVLFPFYQVK